MSFILVTGVLLATAFSAGRLLKTSFAAMVPTTVFAVALVLYVFGLINALRAGFIAVLVGSAVIVVVAIVRSATRSSPRVALRALRHAFSPSFAVFLALAVASFITTRGMRLSSFDEFTEWGAVVKAMFLDDKLSVYSPIELAFRGYQPGIGLFQYFVERFGDWNEADLFWAYQLVVISLFIPFLASLTWRRAGRLVLILPIIFIVPNLFFPTTQLIIVDPVLGLLFGYCLALVYTNDSSRRVPTLHLTAALAILVLTKDSGAFFAIVVLVALLAQQLRRRGEGGIRKSIGAVLIRVGIPVLGVAVAYGSWKAIIGVLHANPELSASNINLLQLVFGPARSYWPEVVASFRSAFLREPLIESHRLELSPASLLLACAVILVLLEFWRQRRWGLPRDFSTAIVITVGAVVYTVGLLVLYLFKFGDYEALHLASFVRYLSTYWAGIAMLIALFVIFVLSEARPTLERRLDPQRWAVSSPVALALVWLLLLAVLAPAKSLVAYVRDPVSPAMSARSSYDWVIHAAHAARIGRGDRVWLISQYDQGYDYWVLRYELMPANAGSGAWSLGPPNGTDDVWTLDLSQRAWASQLRNYDYVVIQKSSSSFVARFGSLFGVDDEIADGTVYSVSVEGDSVHLSRVP